MSLWSAVSSIFLPQVSIPAPQSLFDGDPEQERRERPLPTSSITRWLQRDIESAIHMADTGDLTLAAKLSRSLRRDGALGGILSTRTSGLARLPKQFRGTPEVIADLETRGEVGLFDRVFSPKELALMTGDGILLGVGVGELVPLPDRREPVFVRLDPEYLRYQWSDDTWYYMSIGGRLKITPGDGRWILHMPGGYQQPWQNGLWASLARSFVAKDHAFNYRENYSGKLANPARAAVAPPSATETQRKGFIANLIAWGINSVFELPPGWDVKLLESNGKGFEVFQQTIDSSDKEFMIGLAGQIVTITGGAGFANADIHATIRGDLIQDDGDGLATTVNGQGLRPVVNSLYGGDACATVGWDTKPPADLSREAASMLSCAQAIQQLNLALAPYGLRVEAREVMTRYRVPVVGTTPAAAPSVAPTPSGPPQLSLVPNTGGDAGDPTADDEPSGDETAPDQAAALAAKMTEHGITRCEHGALNRCRLCGIERTRDFDPGLDGNDPRWRIAWQPIPVVAA